MNEEKSNKTLEEWKRSYQKQLERYENLYSRMIAEVRQTHNNDQNL